MKIKDANVGILEFIYAKGKLAVLFIQSKDEIKLEIMNIPQNELDELIGLYIRSIDYLRKYINEGNTKYISDAEMELKNLSTKMYAVLIPQGINDIIKKMSLDYLIVIPHKQLHLLPFELLYDGDDYWGLKYTISKSFSLDLLRISLEKAKKRPKEFDLTSLLVANPNYNEKIGNYSLSFPMTEKEVNKIVNILKRYEAENAAEVLWRDNATEDRFVELANSNKYGFIHFAGHAYWEGRDPWLSFLMFSGYTTRGGEARLHLSEIVSNMQFKANPLVVLSACESGVTKTAAGDEIFGIVRGLLLTGATTMIMSNWAVNDYAACDYMLEFYRHWLKGMPAAIALREARIFIRKRSEEGFYGDPKISLLHWAAFTLFGDPFRQIKLLKEPKTKIKQLSEVPAEDTTARGIILRGLPKTDEGYFENKKI